MNPFTEEICCSICGGPGVTTLAHAADAWLGAELRHSDPAVCAEYLAKRKRELDAQEAALKEREK